jgi:hypothetical protein
MTIENEIRVKGGVAEICSLSLSLFNPLFVMYTNVGGCIIEELS